MEGMNFDVNTNEGKLISAMLGLLEDLAEQVTEHDNELSRQREKDDEHDRLLREQSAMLKKISEKLSKLER